MFIVSMGTISDGYSFIGPFKEEEHAWQYVEEEGRGAAYCAVLTLHSPDMGDED